MGPDVIGGRVKTSPVTPDVCRPSPVKEEASLRVPRDPKLPSAPRDDARVGTPSLGVDTACPSREDPVGTMHYPATRRGPYPLTDRGGGASHAPSRPPIHWGAAGHHSVVQAGQWPGRPPRPSRPRFTVVRRRETWEWGSKKVTSVYRTLCGQGPASAPRGPGGVERAAGGRVTPCGQCSMMSQRACRHSTAQRRPHSMRDKDWACEWRYRCAKAGARAGHGCPCS